MNDQEKAPVPDELPEPTLLRFSAHPEHWVGKRITEVLIVFCGGLILSLIKSWLSLQIRHTPDPLCPLTGFALACLLRYSYGALLPLLVGTALGPLIMQTSLYFAVGEAFGAVAGATAGWLCLKNIRRKDFSLVYARDVLQLIGIGGLSASAVGATFHAWLGIGPEAMALKGHSHLWFALFISSLASIIAFTPAVFFLLTKDFGMPTLREKRVEIILLYITMALCIALSVFFPFEDAPIGTVAQTLPYLALFSIALRAGLRPVAMASAFGLLGMFILFDAAGDLAPKSGTLLTMGAFPVLVLLSTSSCLLMGIQRDAITASQLQTRLALAAADFCQWEWSRQGGLKFHSTAWTKRIGLEGDSFLPLQRWIETVHPDDNTMFAQAITEGAKGRSPGFNVRFRSKDAQTGKWFWSKSVSIILKSDSDQRPLQAVGIVVDINSDVEAEELRLATAHDRAELEALRAQLNPHFLFNCLNSVRALVGKDPARAREMITSLSALLRYLLKGHPDIFETVETEMGVVMKYLSIEQIRFGAKLVVETSISSETLAGKIPSMIILTLVENAIKHGISKLEGEGLIRIEIAVDDGFLAIRVSNTGQLEAARKGIGLENTRRRMKLFSGDAATFQIFSAVPNVVTAYLSLPLKSH
jgi:PAS domain-containing protein